MIRQLCPQCFATVELPPEAAGHDTPCPKCGKVIAVPAAYTPSVSTSGGLPGLTSPTPKPPTPPGTYPMSDPIAPPGLNPATVALPPLAAPPTVTLPVADSGMRSFGISLNSTWLDWVPAACFTLILIATFCSWVGTYPGGVRVYSQNPWFALTGGVSTNTLPEELLADEKYLEAAVTGNRWLIIYFPMLFAALLLSWLACLVRNPNINTIPGPLAWLPKIWDQRFLIITAISASLLCLILIQTWSGYGLETAIKQKVNEQYAKQLEAATSSTPKTQTVNAVMGAELAKYQLQGTIPLNTAIALHVVALLAILGSSWMHNRGNKPHPRISMQY